MKRIAILGGGIAGLAAAYELELARKRGAAIGWHLYEATDRLGGIVETTRLHTPEGEWILEGGPDAWVSEKPWARELAIELGLESELIHSNDATRKTHIYLDGRLQAMPDRMRMMVPEDLTTLDGSPLFSDSARQAYADELTRTEELKQSSPFTNPAYDESVSTFVHRHFGDEVLQKTAAPLLSGVFGGNVDKLSVRAVMAPFVKMEQEHGSLIAALQARRQAHGDKPRQPMFTSLRGGLSSLVQALVATLPVERLHLGVRVRELLLEEEDDPVTWSFAWGEEESRKGFTVGQTSNVFDDVLLATSLSTTRQLLQGFDPVQTTLLPSSRGALSLLPVHASSAVLVSFCWKPEAAATFTIPSGFGFLVPQRSSSRETPEPQLLAGTFVDQKFPGRCPAGSRIIRVFFGTDSAEHFAGTPDDQVSAEALKQLQGVLGKLPSPDASLTTVRRWPRSLPQYEVGHIERIAQLRELTDEVNLTLLGNAYNGVGLPDLIRDARAAARSLATRTSS